MVTQSRHRLSEPVSARDHLRGRRSAAISLVEYGDFECPYCRAAEPIVAGLLEALGNQLSVTFRHFPRRDVHPHAQRAAEVAEAAGAQGKFWEMHDMLLANQDALDDDSLMTYAAALALDVDLVGRELATKRYAPRVAQDLESGRHSGVTATPTFFVDGIRYDGSVALRNMLA